VEQNALPLHIQVIELVVVDRPDEDGEAVPTRIKATGIRR